MKLTKKQFHRLSVASAFFCVVALNGCSSTETIDETEVPPVADAGTDAVPQSSPESTAQADAPPPVEGAPPVAEAPKEEPQKDLVAENKGEGAPQLTEPVQKAQVTPPVAAVSPAQPGQNEYTVGQGDTLMKIAFEQTGDLFRWKEILESNRGIIENPNRIPAGTKLMVFKVAKSPPQPKGDKFMIRRGDTLGTISDDVYGTQKKWKRLWDNNKPLISDPNRIFAGFYLYYTMTNQDRRDLERFKEPRPTPLARVTPQERPVIVQPKAEMSRQIASESIPVQNPSSPSSTLFGEALKLQSQARITSQ